MEQKAESSLTDDDGGIAYAKELMSVQQHDSRLFFPMIEEKMNSYEYPYMTATLSELICMLKMGGSRSTFLFEEHALASILIKAIVENRHKNIVFLFSTKFARLRFVKKFKKSVRHYHIVLGQYDAKEEFDFIGDIGVLRFDERVLIMKNGLVCDFHVSDDRSALRGMSLPTKEEGFTITYRIDKNSACFREFIVPVLCGLREHILSLHTVDDDQATQMRKSIGLGSPTLKVTVLETLGSVFEACSVSCRSCKRSKESWKDEVEALKNSPLPPWSNSSKLNIEAFDE